MMMAYVSLSVILAAFVLALTGCITHKHPPMVCQMAISSTGTRAFLCEAIEPSQVREGVKPDA